MEDSPSPSSPRTGPSGFGSRGGVPRTKLPPPGVRRIVHRDNSHRDVEKKKLHHFHAVDQNQPSNHLVQPYGICFVALQKPNYQSFQFRKPLPIVTGETRQQQNCDPQHSILVPSDLPKTLAQPPAQRANFGNRHRCPYQHAQNAQLLSSPPVTTRKEGNRNWATVLLLASFFSDYGKWFSELEWLIIRLLQGEKQIPYGCTRWSDGSFLPVAWKW